jgi:DNA-binding NarL/FixJ family response regulator
VDDLASKIVIGQVRPRGERLFESVQIHLLDAISFVRDGGVYVSPMLRGAGLFAKAEKGRPEDPLAALSPREMEVFSYLVNGLRAKDTSRPPEAATAVVKTGRNAGVLVAAKRCGPLSGVNLTQK